MMRTIEAVFENGVFKPLQPVACEEGQRVQIYLPYEPDNLTAEQRLKLLGETRRVFGELSDEKWAEVSDSWKRG